MFKAWHEEKLAIFAGMYAAKTLKEGEQIIFAMEGLSDETAYIVLHAEKNSLTLTLCLDRRSLMDYAALMLSRKSGADKLKIASQMLSLNCLQCHTGQFDEQPLQGYMVRFDYMQDTPAGETLLRRYRAGYLPDSELSQEEMRLIMAALDTVLRYFREGGTVQKAAEMLRYNGKVGCLCRKRGMDLSGMDDEALGWKQTDLDEHTQVEFISPWLEDELLTRRLLKKPVSGATLFCAMRSLPVPISENPVRTPLMLGMIDDQCGVAGTDIIQDYEEEYSTFATAFISYVEECGRPARVIADDPRTFSLLCALCGQLQIPIEQTDTPKQMDELFHAYMEMVCSGMRQQERDEEEYEEARSAAVRSENGEGVCILCGDVLSAEDMKAHISVCIQNESDADGEENLLLRISDVDDADYWMYAFLKKDASLAQLDNFLRDVWVDCCGHMSVFTVGGEEYYSSNAREMGGHSMNARVFKGMACGTEMLYEYDFGTPTRLKIELVDEYKAKKRQRKALQLARNIQPKYTCVSCGRRAELVESRMGESISEMAYCEVCASEKAQREGCMMLPILNSPRCGVCGYGAWMLDDSLFEDEDE